MRLMGINLVSQITKLQQKQHNKMKTDTRNRET